ncbi:roundabout homolog 2-like [Saccoglossus kowalevskii]
MEAVCKFLPVAVFILNCVIIELECAIVFTHVASDTIVVQGKSLTLPCSAVNTGSHGDIQRQWTRDGVPVTIGSRIHLFQNGSLYISQTLPGDEGEYVCIASIIGQQGSNVETIPANVYFAFIDPVFYHPASQTVTDGEQYTHLQCVSGDSRPPVEINWEKDGVPFTEGTSYQTLFGNVESIKQSGTLQINNIREELAGHFRCVTVNPLLRDQPEYSNYATLTVNPREGPPYVVLSPSNITVGVGSPASMECQIIGTPTPTISWIKLGEIGAIINSPARYVQDNTLYITSVDDGDAGVYICTGSNSEGSISADPAYLIVASMGTSFLQQPSDTLAVLGTTVTLICRPPVSNPPSVVTWYKDNAIIQESSQKIILDNGDLYMPSVILSDAGVYFCAATNSYIPRTLTSRTATLSIQVGALITIPPSNAQTVIHDRVMFTCTADGDPKPEIKWYKQQELIDDDYYDSRYSIGFDGESLTITDVIYNDQGTYVCEASNGVNVDRASAFLDVIVPPQIDVGPPSDLTARVGSAVLVNCEVLGDPTPTVSWFKDEFPLIWSAENTRYISTPQGLQIMNVVTSDAGVYRCHAENEAGIAEESGVLRVEDVPVITQGPLSQTVNEGHLLTMTCQASAFPEPSYSWLYNDGEMLPPQAIVSQDGRQLSIPQTEDDNSGTYTCRVDNLHGYDKATATLFVRVVPSVNPLEDVLIEQGETLLMTCNAQGKPEPSIQWLKGDDSITPDTRLTLPTHNTLQISPVLASDEGEYHCIAHNPAGSGRTTFQLTVSVKATAPLVMSATAVSTSEVILTWIPGTITETILYYVIQYAQRYSSDWLTYPNTAPYVGGTETYRVSGLQSNTEYIFQVLAMNQYGLSQPSNQMAASTLSDRIGPSPPRNLQVIGVNSTSIHLQWEIPEERDSDIVAYEIQFIQTDLIGGGTLEIESTGVYISTAVISNLLTFTTYRLRVRAASFYDGGIRQWGNYSEYVQTQTLHGGAS